VLAANSAVTSQAAGNNSLLVVKGWVLRTADASSNTTATSVCAGQRLCGAPRRNRTGDPILTMDRRPSAVLTRLLAVRPAASATPGCWPARHAAIDSP
jgi:hypothetical protein